MDLAATLQYLRCPLPGHHDHLLDDWPALDHRPRGPAIIDGTQRALRECLAAA